MLGEYSSGVAGPRITKKGVRRQAKVEQYLYREKTRRIAGHQKNVGLIDGDRPD